MADEIESESNGVFYDLLQDGYVQAGQAVQIRWFTSFVQVGVLTESGHIQLASEPYLDKPETESDTDADSSELVAVKNEVSQHKVYPINISLGCKFRAPSTVTESSYGNIQEMPIVLPKNDKEAAETTYENILNRDKVRHNGWRKLEFLYVMYDRPTIVTLQAVKLRKAEDRKKIRAGLLRPLMFTRVASALMPVDDLAVVENNLYTLQSPEVYQQTQFILQQLRQRQVTTADNISFLVDKLAQAQHNLLHMQLEQMQMQNYMRERADMINNHLRGDPMMNQEGAYETLVNMFGTNGVNVDEILACDNLPPPTTVPAQGQPNRLDKVLSDVWNIYSNLLQRFNETQPEVKQGSSDFYRRMYNSSVDDKLLQSFYDCIDSHYNGNSETMKEELNTYITTLHRRLTDSFPLSMEDCGGNSDNYWAAVLAESADEERNSLIREFNNVSELMLFLDIALCEKQKKLNEFISDSLVTGVEREVDLGPSSTKTLVIQDIKEITYYVRASYVPKRQKRKREVSRSFVKWQRKRGACS